jgi:hypothetical protein
MKIITMRLSSSCFAVLLAGLLSGCAFQSSPYGVSVKNVEAIKAAGIKPVSVATFQSARPGLNSITCRAAGPVTVASSFEAYIEQAFKDELKVSGLYDPASSLVLSGKLEEVDFSSSLGGGAWNFTLTISNGRQESYTTKSTFPLTSSFVADRACQEVAQGLSPAVQKLIEDVVRDPKFRQIAN